MNLAHVVVPLGGSGVRSGRENKAGAIGEDGSWGNDGYHAEDCRLMALAHPYYHLLSHSLKSNDFS